ncbi:MAG: F0F1 ATP synthase subunit delta [Patescibacteria group bacterium]
MNLVIPDSVASAQDLSSVLNDVRTYAKWASRELIKQKVAGKSTGAQPELSKEAADVIRSWNGGKALTQTSIDGLVAALEAHKKTAPTITITLAAVPSGEVKNSLVAWCRKELAGNVLVSFRLNRNILGGMVVAYGSHIHDWSFRRKLMQPNKPFHEVLNHV